MGVLFCWEDLVVCVCARVWLDDGCASMSVALSSVETSVDRDDNTGVAYSVPSFSSDLSDTGAGMISPFTVLPLHRDCLTVGVSQLDQSSSSNWSNVSGVQEKCFRALVAAAVGVIDSPVLDVALDAIFCRSCW